MLTNFKSVFSFYTPWKNQKTIGFHGVHERRIGFNPLSANPIKWSNTLKQFFGKLPTNCLSMFDHFMELALKGLM